MPKARRSPVSGNETPLWEAPVSKLTTAARVAQAARKRLNARHAELKSWALVSRELGGVNRGILSGVANGKREPTPQLLAALGLPVLRKATAPVCPIHGVVHLRKTCPPDSTRKRTRKPSRGKRALALLERILLSHGWGEVADEAGWMSVNDRGPCPGCGAPVEKGHYETRPPCLYEDVEELLRTGKDAPQWLGAPREVYREVGDAKSNGTDDKG